MKGLRCMCGKTAKRMKNLRLNEHTLDGWKCSCGELYFDPEQAQRILLLNKLKKEAVRVKLGKIRSNLILRLPKSVEQALNLKKGEDVLIRIEEKGLRIEAA